MEGQVFELLGYVPSHDDWLHQASMICSHHVEIEIVALPMCVFFLEQPNDLKTAINLLLATSEV